MCEQFEAAWRAGGAPRIEDYLAGAEAADRKALLRELVALERELRRRGGRRAVIEEYLDRFPAQAEDVRAAFGAPPEPDDRPARPPRDTGRDLLLGVLALQNNFIGRDDLLGAFAAWVADKTRPLGRILVERDALDEARRALLEALVAEHLKQHGGDTEASLAAVSSLGPVRADLERLGDADLQASLAATTARAAGAGADIGATATYAPTSRRAGARFRIVRFHREGGLGCVYVARDEEFGRVVALKEIRPDKVAEAHLRSRFVLEAEITGGLEHPGIVPVYSLGTYEDGRPFYAMRFVEGDSLKEAIESYHREHPRPDPNAVEFRKLLGRFVDVCEAIAFAHGKGVLHRDIKPGNIIVGRHGETLVVDWGLAKATGQSDPGSGEKTLMPGSASGSAETLPGSALGTPAYMSPEQAEGDLERLGPRSDVYSLGATLYSLLTGQAPLVGEPGEVLRAVRQGEFRVPRLINPTIDRALEAVCLKAMALRPEDRYSSCRALAEDIERWMADEPVSAWREPVTRRAVRWARRNRSAMTGAAAAVLAGLIGLAAVVVVQTHSNRELTAANEKTSRALEAETKAKNTATEALRESNEARQRAEAVLGFLKDDVLAAARPRGQEGGLGVEVTVRKAVDAAEPKIAGAFRNQPIVEADIRNTLGDTYRYLGEAPLAIRQYELAVDLRRSKLGTAHPETLSSQVLLADAYLDGDRLTDAFALLKSILAQRESSLGPDHPLTHAIRGQLAKAYTDAGRLADAIALLKVALARQESSLGPDQPDTLVTRSSLATAYIFAGQLDDAIRLHKMVLEARESSLGSDHPETIGSRNNLAGAYQAAGRYADAITLHKVTLKLAETSMGRDHPNVLVVRNNLAQAYLAVDRCADAVPLFEVNLDLYKSRLIVDHPNLLSSRHGLAIAYFGVGRTAEAIALLEATLERREAKMGPTHPNTLTSRDGLARMYLATGRTADAIAIYEMTLERRLSTPGLGPDHHYTLITRNNLANAYRAGSRIAEAIDMHEANLERGVAVFGPDHPSTLAFRNNLATDYASLGRWADAETLRREAIARRRKADKPDMPLLAGDLDGLGGDLLDQEKWSEAEPVLREAVEIRAKSALDDWSRFHAMSQLGGSLLGQGRYAEAEPLVISGYEEMKAREARIPSPNKPRLTEAAERVVRLYEAWGKPDQAAGWKQRLGLADLPADVFARP